MKIARWPALVLIPLLLLAAVLLSDDDPDAATEPVDDVQVLGPLLASPDSLGAFWFCAGGTGVEGSAADHSVIVTNTTDEDRLATLTVYGSRPADGVRPEPVSVQFGVAPYTRSDPQLLRSFLPGAEYVSATVEIDGGGVLVEHEVTGPLGNDRAPCATTTSGDWVVPFGATDSTAPNATARELLVLFNPFPADAVLDATFFTERGARGTPEDFNGLVVPGRSVVGIDLAAIDVTASDEVSATITARTGRVVVDRIQVLADPAAGRVGVALSSGVPAPSETWTFAAGGLGPTRREQLFVANPGTVPSEVDVEVRPMSDELAPEPFQLTVQPGSHVLLDLAAEERLASFVTDGQAYTLIVRTADGTKVAAERVVSVAPGQFGAGLATGTGAALAGLRLTADMSGAQTGSELVLFNPSSETIARVRLSVVGGGRSEEPLGAEEIEIEPGSGQVIAITDLSADPVAVVVMESNVPIIAERDVVGPTDRWSAMAVPDLATASIARQSLFADLGE